MIICGGTRDVTKDGVRALSEFARLTTCTNVIVIGVPHRFDLQPSSCVNGEVESFNRKVQKTMKSFSHVHGCSMSTNRDHFTSHGLHLNSQGKNWIIGKWVPIILTIISNCRVVSAATLPWLKMSDDSYNEPDIRKAFYTKEIAKVKGTHSLSQENVSCNAPELEASNALSKEEGIPKDRLELPSSKQVNITKEVMMRIQSIL